MNVIRMIGWEKIYPEEIAALKAAPGAADEVWLGVYGYSAPEEHEKRAKDFARHKEIAEKAGFRVVFEMGSTLGHVPEMPETEVTKNFRKMVGMHGESMPGAFCPRGENLIRYQTAVVKRYMRTRPFAMMIDDDMRLEFRNGIGYGCFCKECVRLFNQNYGYDLPREEIEVKFVSDPAFRKKYIEHNRAGMAAYAYALASAAHEVAPDAFVGFENCFLGAHNGGNLNHIFDALHRATGKPVFSRAGAFYYKDVSPRDVLDKVLNISYQNTQLPPYVAVRRPEIENTDNTSMGKSVRGTMMEAELNLAFGCTGTSFHMVGQESEPLSYENRYFMALSAERKYFEKIKELASRTRVDGLRPALFEDAYLLDYVTENEYRHAENKDALSYCWADVPKERGRELLQIGMPLSYEGTAFLLHPDMVPYLSDSDVELLLKSRVLTDGSAVSALIGRGYGQEFPLLARENVPASLNETYIERETSNGISMRGHTDGFCGNRFSDFLIEKERILDTAALAVGKFGAVPLAISEDGRTTAALFTTASGGVWGAAGSSPFNIFMNAAKRRFLLNLADRVAGGLSALLLSSEQAVIVPRVTAEGKFAGVFTHSVTLSDSEELTYLVRRPASLNFAQYTSEGERRELRFEKQGEDEYLVFAPALRAYRSTLIVCE